MVHTLEDDLINFYPAADSGDKIILIEYEPTLEEFNHKVKAQAGHLHSELQDVTTSLFNSVVFQTEKGKQVGRRLLTALAELTEISGGNA